MYPAMQNRQCLPHPRVISERYISLNSVFGVRITVAAGDALKSPTVRLTIESGAEGSSFFRSLIVPSSL